MAYRFISLPEYKHHQPVRRMKPSLTVRSGYVPPSILIERMLSQGERLQEFRREMYHYGDISEDDGASMYPEMHYMDTVDAFQFGKRVLDEIDTVVEAAKKASLETGSSSSTSPHPEGPEADLSKKKRGEGASEDVGPVGEDSSSGPALSSPSRPAKT